MALFTALVILFFFFKHALTVNVSTILNAIKSSFLLISIFVTPLTYLMCFIYEAPVLLFQTTPSFHIQKLIASLFSLIVKCSPELEETTAFRFEFHLHFLRLASVIHFGFIVTLITLLMLWMPVLDLRYSSSSPFYVFFSFVKMAQWVVWFRFQILVRFLVTRLFLHSVGCLRCWTLNSRLQGRSLQSPDNSVGMSSLVQVYLWWLYVASC